jgi:hypothetical protein
MYVLIFFHRLHNSRLSWEDSTCELHSAVNSAEKLLGGALSATELLDISSTFAGRFGFVKIGMLFSICEISNVICTLKPT